MDNKTLIEIGGSIEKAEKGQYQLDVFAILKEAWSKTQTTKQPILLGLVAIFLIGGIVSAIFFNYFGGVEVVMEDQKTATALNLLVSIIIWPFLAGVEMMGLYHSVGIRTKGSLIFSFLKRGSWVVITALFVSTIISVGIELFVVPGVFIAVATSLAVPLVVEKRLSPLRAIWLSLKALTFQWFKIFTLYLLMTSLLILSVVPYAASPGVTIIIPILAIGYLAPLFYNMKGILYREIFGMQVEVQIDGTNKAGEDYFSA